MNRLISLDVGQNAQTQELVDKMYISQLPQLRSFKAKASSIMLAKYEYDTANGISYSYPYRIHLGGAVSYF